MSQNLECIALTKFVRGLTGFALVTFDRHRKSLFHKNVLFLPYIETVPQVSPTSSVPAFPESRSKRCPSASKKR